jgi:hypothetical protein
MPPLRNDPNFGMSDAAVDDARPDDRRSAGVIAEDAELAPNVAAAVRELDDGRAFTVIVETDPDASARVVRNLAQALKARGASVTVVRNLTPWPMTVDKLIPQIGAEPGSDPELLLREATVAPPADQGRAVLVIDQADTLDDAAMAFLARLSQALRANGSQFQLVFAGHDTLAAALRSHGLGASRPDRARRGAVLPIVVMCVAAAAFAWLLLADRDPQAAREAPAAVAEAPQPPAPQPAAPPADQPAPAASDRTAVVQAPAPGVAESQPPPASAPAVAPLAPAPAAPVSAAPVSAAPAPAAPAPAAPEPSAAASVEEREAALRRDFDAFLDKPGMQTAKLTPAQRDALFKDYLVWRLRPAASSPAAAAP